MSRIWAIVAALFLGMSACAAAVAQTSPGAARVPYDGSDSPSGPKPIHVDERCRILPGSEGIPLSKKTRPYIDSAICDLENQDESAHWEEKISGNELERWFVRVKEQTFVLRDISDEPMMFIVQFNVPHGWLVDSDPQPWQMMGQTAYFRVFVKPGETVRLHVGVRRIWAQKPKPI